MAMNGENNVEEAEMSECDGEQVVTMMDVLQEQEEFEEDANAVLGASDDMNCTYPKGYIKRQALYACLTCCAEARYDETKQAGVCLACSLNCHENHDLIELYTKRNFRCDCGNPKFGSHPCQFTPNKTELNTDNNYNQNFSGIYCSCRRPYPDPESKEEEEMIQCIICEDWLHTTHLEAAVPSHDQYSEMVCKGCMEKNEFLHDYSHLAVNIEMGDIDIVNVNGNDSICNGKADDNLINGDITDETRANDMETETNLPTNDTENTIVENEEDTNTETSPKTVKTNNEIEKMDTENADTSEKVNQEGSESNNEPVIGNTEQIAIESTETVKENADTVSENTDSNSEENKEENIGVNLKTQENVSESTDKESVNPDTSESDKKADTKEVTNKNDINDNGTKEEPDSIEDKPTDTLDKSLEKTDEIMDTSENKVNEASTDEVKTSDNIEDNTEFPNKQAAEENIEAAEVNEESAEENKVSAEENKVPAEENKVPAEENKETVEENKESAEENKVSAEENKVSAEENKVSTDENKESVEENKESETVEAETKPDSIEADKIETTNPTTSTDEQNSTNGSLNISNNVDEVSDSTEVPNPPEKRKMTDENGESHSKKPKLDSTCIRPKNVKRIYKGATFWPSHFRQKLCTCNECISMYKDLSVLFLTDPEDTVSAYEMLGKERNNGEPSTQYEKGLKALSSLNRVQQINALTEYNKMRDKLLDFLKSFKDKKEVVKEEDIRAFFAGMKPKREPDGVYFCR